MLSTSDLYRLSNQRKLRSFLDGDGDADHDNKFRRRQCYIHEIALIILTFNIIMSLNFCQVVAGNEQHYNSLQSSALNNFQQFDKLTSSIGEKPKLIPIVVADSGYSENSSVNILCTVSQGHHETLTFDWFKDNQLLSSSQSSMASDNLQQQPQIEKHSDHSLLRISRVSLANSGRYTCSVKNQFGSDSSTANLIVNVKLQWIKEPTKEITVSVNQELKLDCLAQGEPRPSMRWEKLLNSPADTSSLLATSTFKRQQQQLESFNQDNNNNNNNNAKNQLTSSSAGTAISNGYKLASSSNNNKNSLLVSSNRYLNIQKTKESDGGLYECVASNSRDQDLRKLVHVQVRGELLLAL